MTNTLCYLFLQAVIGQISDPEKSSNVHHSKVSLMIKLPDKQTTIMSVPGLWVFLFSNQNQIFTTTTILLCPVAGMLMNHVLIHYETYVFLTKNLCRSFTLKMPGFPKVSKDCLINLTLSLPASIMETGNVVLTFESLDEITIHMKSLSQYCRMVLFVWQDLKNRKFWFFLNFSFGHY